MMENKKTNELEQLIEDVKSFISDYKRVNGRVNITNKDLLLYLLKHTVKHDKEITEIKTRQKMLMWFLAISVSALAIIANFI